MKRSLWAVWVLSLLVCGFFGYKYYKHEEKSPAKLQTHVESLLDQNAQLVSAGQIARLQAVRKQPRVESTLCRQLPAHIDRTNNPFWGLNDQGQVVQLQNSYPEILSFDVQVDHMYMVGRIINATQTLADPPKPLADGPLKVKIESAKRRILSTRNVPCAYEWSIVQGIVALYGEHLIVRGIGEINPLAQYEARIGVASIYQDRMRILAYDAERESDMMLSIRMVRSATAMVFARSFSVLSGFAPDVLDAFRTLCPPFNISYAGFEEAALLWNEGRFLEAVRYELDDQNHPDLKMMKDVDRGNFGEFIARVTSAVRDSEQAFIQVEQKLPPHYTCKYPPRLNGPNQGVQLFPNELNDPMINFVMLTTSEQSKVAYGVK